MTPPQTPEQKADKYSAQTYIEITYANEAKQPKDFLEVLSDAWLAGRSAGINEAFEYLLKNPNLIYAMRRDLLKEGKK